MAHIYSRFNSLHISENPRVNLYSVKSRLHCCNSKGWPMSLMRCVLCPHLPIGLFKQNKKWTYMGFGTNFTRINFLRMKLNKNYCLIKHCHTEEFFGYPLQLDPIYTFNHRFYPIYISLTRKNYKKTAKQSRRNWIKYIDMFTAKYYSREQEFYTDNICASMTIYMKGLSTSR